MAAIPMIAIAAGDSFDDVPDGHRFYDSIEWMAANGITDVCNPHDAPANTNFCPDDFVTRGEVS
jgi:hypothetical protein